MLARSTKPNRCKHCKERMPAELARHVLHEDCIAPFLDARAAKKEADRKKKEVAARKLERAETRRRKQAIKTIPDLIRDAQRAFNAFIRARDQAAGHACISSGRPLDWSGNAVDAGHYRSTGAAAHLRFNEDNCHAQSKHDNQYKSGNAVDYRVGLIARIGIARVEALEADNGTHKWMREELIAIRALYVKKLKTLSVAAGRC